MRKVAGATHLLHDAMPQTATLGRACFTFRSSRRGHTAMAHCQWGAVSDGDEKSLAVTVTASADRG